MDFETILNGEGIQKAIKKLASEIFSDAAPNAPLALIGIATGGVPLARRLYAQIKEKRAEVYLGELDITFYRDDFRRRENPLVPNRTQIDFIIEDKNVILVDDVLYTGRTIRAGMDALLAFGRPKKVELMVLIDRRYSRHLPIQPDYVGKVVDTITSDNVKVKWNELDGSDEVLMITENHEKL